MAEDGVSGTSLALTLLAQELLLIFAIARGTTLAEHHYSGQIAIVARDEADAASLRTLGRVEIILPFNQTADYAALDLSARIAESEPKKSQETSS